MFRVGQKVTLIRNNKRWMSVGGPVPSVVPAVGQVLTVKFTDIWGDRQYLEFPQWPSAMWAADYFRPIVERKTSIEIFTAMLTPKKAKEPV